MEDKIIRMPEVMAKVGLRKSAVYNMIKRGEFPAQIRLGENSVGWIEADVDEWVRVRGEIGRDRGNESLARIIRMPMDGEVLNPGELALITGRQDMPSQAKWLVSHGWVFHHNDEGRLIVGRLYSRLKLCGIDLPGMVAKSNRVPGR
ncbi:AlpA family phage regulatory protein [Ferribacterium limneticum]|uniref:AlpA family phage regulatory protein n=1 Tax=Ferribacterium limneticum TaxID=76259 RepID=UPI001CF9A21C|nr:AlpA family phage regulatory protein [Ferribacterium limneticum]UCV28105.1 AlpA family phage regulatory protein [Ferribacterium limneticum]UCV32022.1 AlpA family phage regulatory protein [Ferribacterium limneticum]